MEDLDKVIEEIVYRSPLTLLKEDLAHVILEKSNNYLPYSVGIEIEANQKDNFVHKIFEGIPDIIEVYCSGSEQRFRIPNGIKGLICLYNICMILPRYCELNTQSGIHYHIDMTESYHLFNDRFIQKNKKWILEELDTWEYKGTYNTRDIQFSDHHRWLRFQSCFKTAEFRIGEMSFDYKVLIKRIIHASSIIRRLKTDLGIDTTNVPINNVNNKLILDWLKANITKTKVVKPKYEKPVKVIEGSPMTLEEIRNAIKNRNI